MTTVERSIALELHSSMDADHRRPKSVWNSYSDTTHKLREELKQQWAKTKGVIEARGQLDWHRLLGKGNRQVPAGLPGDDHVTMWRKPSDRGQKISLWVSQPYQLSAAELHQINLCMQEYTLECAIRTWPSWHYPGSVLFLEWSVIGETIADC